MATTAEKLAEARDAYHKLLIGQSVVEVWDGTFRVFYTKADLPRLQEYISSLETQIATEDGTPFVATRRPLTFVA